MNELPDPKVFESWERWQEKVKTWQEVQKVFDWINGDADLQDMLMNIRQRKMTPEEARARYVAILEKRGELPARTQ